MSEAMIASAIASHPVALGEEGLVLEVHVVEAIAAPQLLEPLRHAHRLEADPLAPVDERIRAERAAEVAALRGDVVELPLALEREVPLHRDQAVVVRAERVDLLQRARRIGADRAVGRPDRAARAPVERAPFAQALDDLDERRLALGLHGDVDRGLGEAFAREHRRMPAAPDHRQLGLRRLAARETSSASRIGAPGQHRPRSR